MGKTAALLFLACCCAMGAVLLPACADGTGLPNQHSTPALDSLLADSSLIGEAAADGVTADTSGTAVGNGKPAKITMDSDEGYSPEFLKKLTITGIARNIALADSLIILEGKDTFAFPQPLPKATWTNFVASKQGYLYSLDVSRLNYTTLDFNFELRKGRQTIDQIRGKADLNPGFLLGSESDDDATTGSSYLVDEYHFEQGNCSFNIRIGDDEGVKKVKLIKQCKSGKYNIALDECPILLEK